jgi:hypothetical protein
VFANAWKRALSDNRAKGENHSAAQINYAQAAYFVSFRLALFELNEPLHLALAYTHTRRSTLWENMSALGKTRVHTATALNPAGVNLFGISVEWMCGKTNGQLAPRTTRERARNHNLRLNFIHFCKLQLLNVELVVKLIEFVCGGINALFEF